MRKFFALLTLIAFGVASVPVVQAKTTDSEKLQNKINTFQENIEEYLVVLQEANSLQLPELECDEEEGDGCERDEDLELAELKYSNSRPTMSEVLEDIKEVKKLTQYVKGFHKRDIKAMKVTVQDMYIELASYVADLDDYGNEEESSDKLDVVELALEEAIAFLQGNKSTWHNTLELYMKGQGELMDKEYDHTLDILDNTYEIYKQELGEGNVVTFKTNLNNFNSYYSEGKALLDRAKTSSEKRDLQLYNRAIAKFLKARKWAAETYAAIADLEEQL